MHVAQSCSDCFSDLVSYQFFSSCMVDDSNFVVLISFNVVVLMHNTHNRSCMHVYFYHAKAKVYICFFAAIIYPIIQIVCRYNAIYMCHLMKRYVYSHVLSSSPKCLIAYGHSEIKNSKSTLTGSRIASAPSIGGGPMVSLPHGSVL